MAFELSILGPLEVVCDGRPVRLGGPKQRALLTLLALDAGEPVPPHRLIDALWPEHDAGAPARLQVYVSQLRKALGDGGAIELRDGGYALAVTQDAVDAARFERLARQGREALAAGEPESAARLLREALALWREPTPAEIAGGRLAELRVSAREDRIAADLALGRHRELVAELQELVALHPLSERARGALMLALYRSGRQSEALDAYRAARRTLVDELGVEPGPDLRALHAAILRQDADLAVDPAELRARRHLPAPTTSLVGRRRELAELVALLRRDDVRLVTLTGPGGIGKTRLSIQAAAELAERFPHGVYFVALATQEDPTLVPDAIAAALGVAERPDRAILASLRAHLADRRLLLVLDNFEHLDAAAPVVSRLLEAAPGLKALTTSRAALRLYGEHEYRVPPLPLPEPGAPGDSPAVELFVARAQAARHGFALDDDGAVAEICRRLDGLPLAIELAAARIRRLAPAEILGTLRGRLELAGDGPRDAPSRQRTLRATLDWSHRLLDERARGAFARLGVFVDGCDEAAALAVCSVDASELESLVQQSLLEDGAGRFSMLETVREYALERLAASGDEERTRGLQARHFAALAEAGEPALTNDPDGTWLQRLEQEHANLRAALVWCGRAGAVDLELRLVAALARFWALRGHVREGRAWLDGALGRSGEQPPELRARALAAAAMLALAQGDSTRLKAFAAEGLALCESIGDRYGMAQALDRLATAAANEGDHEHGMQLYERSAALFHALGDERGTAISATNIGCLALMQGDLERAVAMSEEGVALYRRIGERAALLQPQFNLGVAILLQDRADEALAIFTDGLELVLDLGYLEGLVYFLEGHAAVHAVRGAARNAAILVGAAEATAERAGASLEPFERALHDRTVETAKRSLGDSAFAAAREHGRGLAPEEATAYARRAGSASPPDGS